MYTAVFDNEGGLAHMWVECSMLQTLSLTQKSHCEDVFEVFHHLIQVTNKPNRGFHYVRICGWRTERSGICPPFHHGYRSSTSQ